MNLNSIWSTLEESFEVFDEISGSAIIKFAEEMHIPSGWGTWVPAAVLFPSEPISSTQYMKIFPYGSARVIDERFASATQHGYLILGEVGYHATEKEKTMAQEGLQVLTNAIANLYPLPSTEFQRLVDYLIRLSEACLTTPEPDRCDEDQDR